MLDNASDLPRSEYYNLYLMTLLYVCSKYLYTPSLLLNRNILYLDVLKTEGDFGY